MESKFWGIFDAAEMTGIDTITRTAAKEYSKCKDNVKELTDLVMVINHKCWEHYRLGNSKLSSFYGDLYYEYYEKAIDYMDGKSRSDDLRYFIRTLD